MTGEAIRALRRRFAMTQRQFANVLAVAPSTAHRWESYGPQEVTVDYAQLRLLAVLVGVPKKDTVLLKARLHEALLRGPALLALHVLLQYHFEE